MPHSYAARTAEIAEAQDEGRVLTPCLCGRHYRSDNFWSTVTVERDETPPFRLHSPRVCTMTRAGELLADTVLGFCWEAG